jgi:hypothetical protein
MTKPLLPIVAALIAFPAFSQQAATPNQAQQSPSAASPSTPCPPPAPSQPRKQTQFEQNLRQKLCQKNSNLCGLPDIPVAPKPCLQASPQAQPAPGVPAPVTTQPTTQVPIPPAAGNGVVCPPRTTLIVGTAFCLTADKQSTVDAIKLPPAQPSSPQH